MKLIAGKLGANRDVRPVKRDLLFAKVAPGLLAKAQLRVPQLAYDARMLARYPILDNDQYGCCTFSSIVRQMINNSIRRKKPITNILPGDVARAYLDMKGGKDEGAQEVDSLTYMRNYGVKGHKVRAFVRVNERDAYEMASALQTFHGLIATSGLPANLDGDHDNRLELTPKDKWTHGDEPRSLGGHAYNVFGQERNLQHVVLWEDRVDEEWLWTDEYREDTWAFIDNHEEDAILIETMEEQLDILRAA